MNSYDPSLPLFSVHIPKCAGSSFSKVLKEWFKENLLLHYPNESKGALPEKHVLRPGICIHGHFNNARGTGLYDYYSAANQLITVVRDPFEMHISNYFFVKRKADENGGYAYYRGKLHPIIENSWTLREYLENQPHCHLLNFFPPDITMENFSDVVESRYLFVGVAENLQKSVDRLSKILGCNSVLISHVNKSNRNEDIPTGLREKFTEEHMLEMEIYKYVKEKFVN